MDIDALAKPHQLCTPCRQFCTTSEILRNIPRNQAIRKQELNDGRELTIRPKHFETFDIHEYTSLQQCVRKGSCHLCSISWGELARGAGPNTFDKIRARSPKNAVLTGIVTSGGENYIGHGLLTFNFGAEKCHAEITLLSASGKHHYRLYL